MLAQSVGRHLLTVGKQLLPVDSPGPHGCCMQLVLGHEQVQLHYKQEEDWVEGVLLVLEVVDWVHSIRRGEQLLLCPVLLAILPDLRHSRGVVLLAGDLGSLDCLSGLFDCGTFACCSLYCSLQQFVEIVEQGHDGLLIHIGHFPCFDFS